MGAMQFYAVEPCGNGAPGGLRKAVDHVRYVEGGHLVWHRIRFTDQAIVLPGSHRAGGDDSLSRVHLRPSHAAAVEDLHDRDTPRSLDRLHHRPPGVELTLSSHARLARVPLCAFIVSDNPLGVDDGGAIPGPSYEEIEHVLPGN